MHPGKITHPLDEILRFRMLAIVAGYPDGNDCDVLRDDPRAPETVRGW